ncbi:response regulator transcription factor [Pseudomonas wadenswilerensis]|jgi:DNA-binding NarL/FixJ family response regulator|uniref:Transcriptional activator protein ExaE n=1 Tax=Pseudomonas wadenswilerensis TaxID=1785161 RepID=A0A380T0W0_9PSED|nr:MULTISPECIES: response regulator transcription factor [Pseudomonas]MCE5982967.1 response regulator transcription factor [Pseudomonas sp. LF19]UVM19541.1 response regulator transcription factor [Pseudomonas wadenswilerensis]SUQ63141.1 Transcriptional activator protein ExaE [Pseudomonas wadenswilerensis]
MAILLVDDHPMLRLGLAAALQQGLEGMAIIEAASGEEALHKVGEQLPGLVIMDFDLPGISGLETTRRLRQRLPQLRVLFFSEHTDLGLVRQAMEAGACGFLSKAAGPAVLLEAVRRVLSGHAYIEQALATDLACQGRHTRVQGLTPRETEIFLMLAKGTPTRLIAEQLCISAKTVSNCLTLLKSKLQVASQAEMVHLAIEAGLLRIAA